MFEDLSKVIKEFGKKATIVVGRSSMKDLQVLSRLEEQCKEEGLEIEIFSGIETNPCVEDVIKGAQMAKDFKSEVIIGLGGGSVLDVAKAISLAASHDGDVWEYRLSGKFGAAGIKNKTIPVITVPTAAGTGSEVTPASVIRKGIHKEVIMSSYMFPKTALVDPALTLSLPNDLTNIIGVNAFVQGLEAFVSTNSNYVSDLYALEALKLSHEALRDLTLGPKDLESRTKLSFGALFGGMAKVLAGVGATHALSAPLCGRCNIRHGKAISTLLIPVMEHNLPYCTSKYAQLAEALGADTECLSTSNAAEWAIDITRTFLKRLGLFPPPRLCEFKLTEYDIQEMARDAINTDLETNPKKMGVEEIKQIFTELL
jgi:alcohol dehydrogenase class IV